jgi:hypothetical protein
MSSILDTPPQTQQQLEQQASSEVQQQLQQQTAPLQQEQESLQGRETAALGSIGSMFDKLQPFVSGEAEQVRSSYDQANNASRAIFEEAQRRLDSLANERAASAQALAQQMGGPVSVGEFTAGVAPDQKALASIAPNQLLHGLANAQAGEQLASAYSQRVFPALRTEETSKARGYFEDQIKDLRKQIDQINSQSSVLKSNRLSDLLKQEREFELQQAQLKLDNLKADRDWEATKRTLHNEDVRLGLAKKQFGLQESSVTGKYKGKKTQSAIKAAAEQRLAAQRMGISVAQYQERVRHNQATEAQARARVQNSQQKNAMAILDAVTGRSKGGMVITHRRELSPAQGAAMAYRNSKVQIVRGADGKNHYYIEETVHLSPQQVQRQYGSGFAADPQQLYDLLIGSNIPKAMATKLVRTKTGVHDFQPGKPVAYTANDLAAIGRKSFNELRGIALSRGFKPNPKHKANTQNLIDFILNTNPAA